MKILPRIFTNQETLSPPLPNRTLPDPSNSSVLSRLVFTKDEFKTSYLSLPRPPRSGCPVLTVPDIAVIVKLRSNNLELELLILSERMKLD